jgi:ABC-2 type transport system permease protein
VACLAKRAAPPRHLTRNQQTLSSVFSTLFRWEIRALRRDPAFWTAVALALAAIAFALFNGTLWRQHLERLGHSVAQVDAQTRAHARELAVRLDREPDPLIAPLRDSRNPYGYAYFQMQHAIALPPTPLAGLAVGQSDVLPTVLPLNPGPPPSLSGTGEPENPHRLLIGHFDAAFVVVYLAPLLVIALTYALIAAERERGTLPLLLTQPLTPRRLVAGRIAPRVLLLIGLVGLIAVASWVAAGAPDAAVKTRLALWTGIALAYVGFWFGLAVVVVSRPRGSAHQALVLASLWLAFVVILPAAINLAVKSLAPVPSRMELILALRAAGDEALAERSKLLAAYYDDHPEFAPKDEAARGAPDFSRVRIVTYQKLERDLAPVLARYEARLAQQQALVEKLQFFSPALLAHSALAEAAGTGLERHREFMRQAARHHLALREFFNPRILRKDEARFYGWDEVPAFRFTEEPPAAVAGRVAPALIGLVAGIAVLGAWAAAALRRHLSIN